MLLYTMMMIWMCIQIVDYLGMGIAKTWRGVPDSRLRSNALDGDIPMVSGHMQCESSGSNGTTTVCEAKLKN